MINILVRSWVHAIVHLLTTLLIGNLMVTKQHTPLVLITQGSPSRTLAPVPLQSGKTGSAYDESWVRDLIFRHPETVPVQEVDPSFGALVPVCTELDTRGAGYADALFLNHLGMPTLVECKLWRNPEARREVVGQILDYARALRRWTYSDLQRESARARKEQGFDLAHLLRQHGHPDLDEAAFADSVTRNLARGRLLLLVIGDGIREGVEALAEYVQGAPGLHFTFGLVEAQLFELEDGRRIMQPRVLARTVIVNRTIVDLGHPDITIVQDEPESQPEPPNDERWMRDYWADLLSRLKLDDAAQPPANLTARNRIFFTLPGKGHWLTCYLSVRQGAIGVYLGGWKNAPLVLEIRERLEADREAINTEIGVPLTWSRDNGKVKIEAVKHYPNPQDSNVREEQLAWFQTTINAFVNALRPRIAAVWREFTEGHQQAVG